MSTETINLINKKMILYLIGKGMGPITSVKSMNADPTMVAEWSEQ